MRLSAIRNRDLSLWQSVVTEMAESESAKDPQFALAIQRAASIHISSVARGERVSQPAFLRKPKYDPPTLAYISQLVFDIARSDQRGDEAGRAAALDRFREFIRQYSDLDILGWMQCVWRYVEYYVTAKRQPPYRDWRRQSPANLSFGVIDFTLPPVAKILLLGDWGTHMTDNVAMLRQALLTVQPDVIIHLGDVYYSGTTRECKQNVLEVMDSLVSELKINRPPFFAIPGNHEYYSGGVGYFDMIDSINSGLAKCQQKASYFCLRDSASRWQLLGMDTGYNDRDPIELAPLGPGLQTSEIEWHRDKLDNFPGSTILLSHHQLVSANATLSRGTAPFLNTDLLSTFSPYFDRIAAWFWGHEHNFVVYKEGQSGLARGRLLGCSAYEQATSDDPYENRYPGKVEYAPNMKRLDLSPYQEGVGRYYNHAMAVLEVSPTKINVAYFQFPSWDIGFTPPHTDVPALLMTEIIQPLRSPEA